MIDLDARRKWACQRGDPYWLWPEVGQAEWLCALREIERAAAACATGAKATIAVQEPVAFGLACYTSGLGPLLGHWLKQGLIGCPPPVAEILQEHLSHNRLRVERMSASLHALAGDFVEAGCRPLVLKGMDTGYRFFPVPETRPASDIDILLARRDLGAAARCLAAQGFVPQGESRHEVTYGHRAHAPAPVSLFMVHADDPWTIDVHWSLDIFVTAGAPLAVLDRALALRAAISHPAFANVDCLPWSPLLLHLAVHAGAAWHNLTMMRLVELLFVIRCENAALLPDWAEFLDMAGRCGALGYCHPALSMCERLVPGSVPAPVLRATAKACPDRVLRALADLTPATAHRISRHSVREHFMWTSGPAGWARQLAADLAPAGGWKAARRLYARRALQLGRARLSR